MFNLKQLQKSATIVSLKVFLATLQSFPRWFTQAIFSLLFPFAYFGIHRLARICFRNLSAAYGNSKTSQECHEMTKACFRSMADAMLDMLYFVKRPRQLKRITQLHGEEHLQEALQEKHGVVIVTAHLGNFPLMFLSLVSLGYKVNVVIRTMRDKEFGKFMYDLCALWGIRMLETFPQKTFIKESYAALRRNELLVILLDEVVPHDEGVSVPFFGSYVSRGTGPMLFHERVASPIVPMFIVKDEQNHFQIHVEPKLAVRTQGAAAECLQSNIASLTETIELHVRRHPTQWGGWLNKRWLSQETSAS